MAACKRMTRRLAVLVMLLCVATAGSAQAQPDPLDIINKVQDLYRGDSSHGTATMEIVTEHWSREMTIESWSLGEDHSLMPDSRARQGGGQRDADGGRRHLELPPEGRPDHQAAAAMMGGSWMGSHFTNDDLIQESRLVDDYDIELTFDGERDGARVWEVTLTPKFDAAVVWGRIEYIIRQADALPASVLYYDEDGELARSMEWSEYENIGGRMMPRLMNMRPADKPEERTTFRYEEMEFDVDVDESFFSLRTLQSRR